MVIFRTLSISTSEFAANSRARLLVRVLAILLPLCLYAASAQPAQDEDAVFTMQVENDRIARTDRHYTHGTRFSLVYPESTMRPDSCIWKFLSCFADQFKTAIAPMYDTERFTTFAGLSLGQNIYTPEDTSRTDLILNDRPYAGWLYMGVSLHAISQKEEGRYLKQRLDTIELNVGIVGPESYAEDVQTMVHDFIDVGRPQGWNNQLDNEPGLILTYERKYRFRPLAIPATGIVFEPFPHFGLNVGNVLTAASAGLSVRVGKNIPDDFGPPSIRPSLPGHGYFSGADKLGWYLFAGAEGRAIARNIFLDGNTIANSHSVDSKPLVGDFQVGMALLFPKVLSRGLRISFTHVFRTREFDGQPQSDRFGALSFSIPLGSTK